MTITVCKNNNDIIIIIIDDDNNNNDKNTHVFAQWEKSNYCTSSLVARFYLWRGSDTWKLNVRLASM